MASNQYITDCGRFAELVEKFTGIEAEKVTECIDTYGGNKLLDYHEALCYSPEQRVKLVAFFEAMSLSMQFKHMVPDRTYMLSCPVESLYYHMNYFFKLPDDRERIVATYVTTNLKVISSVVVSEGALDQAVMPLDKILRDTLLLNAKGVVIAHNHPSGSLDISHLDEHMTENVSNALSTIGKQLFDSIVVTGSSAVSVLEQQPYSYEQLDTLVAAERDRTLLDKQTCEALISKQKNDAAQQESGSSNKSSYDRSDR